MDYKQMLEYAKDAVRSAYDNAKDVIYECSTSIRNEDPLESGHNLNLSSMYTLLVQAAGRFAERFASDVIISINSLDKAISNATIYTEPTIALFGVRRDGVDHLEFVCSQIVSNVHNASYISEYYRKMYAIEFRVEDRNDNKKLVIKMKDIHNELTHAIYTMQDKIHKAY